MTIRMRWHYAQSLYRDVSDAPDSDDFHEAVNMLEDTGRIARRVLGDAHPLTGWIEEEFRVTKALADAKASLDESREELHRAKAWAAEQEALHERRAASRAHNRRYREAYAAARSEGLAPAEAMRRAADVAGDVQAEGSVNRR